MRALAREFLDETIEPSRRYRKFFEVVTRKWVRRELELPEIEAWHHFRARVEAGVAAMIAALGKGQNVAVFSSGGPVATVTGYALGLDDEKVLELSWIVRNAAYAEFFYSRQRLLLSAFNATPHLTDRQMLTYL